MRRRIVPILFACSVAAGSLLALTGSQSATAGTGTPTFAVYAAPSSLPNSNNAGEPSIGVNWNTGAAMYQSYASTYRVSFNDATTPATATWANATPSGSVFNIDPILFTDSAVGRTYAGGLSGECSVLFSTDNDGGSWSPLGNSCTGTVDHETIGAGPYHSPAPLGATYGRAVYYCAQNGTDACATSTSGGTAFGPPALVGGACGSLHGHVKVSADGTAYLPDSHCGGRQGGGISTDNGSSWTSYTIPQSIEPSDGFDPSVATTPDNTVYEAWQHSDNHPYVARSTTHGASWDRATDLSATTSPAVLSSAFQTVVAGDNGRVAVSYLGSTTGGNPFAATFHGTWDLYTSYTYDGGVSWTTVKDTTDPVQRGWICSGGTGCSTGRNLLDFIDSSVTKDGRVVVGFADGCTGACATSSGTEAQSTNAYATIARQSTGKGLFAAYDSTGGTTNAAPTACFSHTESALTTSANGGCSSDTDGTVSSYSWNWGDGSAAGSGATASHTYAAAGTYTVTLTVTDNAGATGVTNQSVTVATSGGGTTDPDPSTPNLTSGVAKSGTSAATAGTWTYYKISVPAGKSQLKTTLAGPSCGLGGLSCNPDLDLYVNNGSKPTTTTYTGSSATSSNSETVTITSPAAAYYYVGVYVYSASKTGSFTVTATIS